MDSENRTYNYRVISHELLAKFIFDNYHLYDKKISFVLKCHLQVLSLQQKENKLWYRQLRNILIR